MKMTLAALRTNAGLTQREAAKEMGVTPGCIYLWEKGKVDPPFSKLLKLCELYGCGVDDIRWS